MGSRAKSCRAVWLACAGTRLLFLARGAFQPYFFPFFENLAGLSYAAIILIQNCYLLSQSFCAPVAGWYADRTSAHFALNTGIVFGLLAFLMVLDGPGFCRCAVAVCFAGLGFVLGKIALNVILVQNSSKEELRRSVAKRATLMNLGSFTGNALAVQVSDGLGYAAHAALLAALHLTLSVSLLAPPTDHPVTPESDDRCGAMWEHLGRRTFVADSLRLFAIILPYGCWGTIIPKYLIDLYGSNNVVRGVYLTSLCTTVIGSHLLAVYASRWLCSRGFRWEWWTWVAKAFFLAGLLLLVFASDRVMFAVAVAVFICGEVVMTPCFDETAKKHSPDGKTGTCLGLLHLVDGVGRSLGATVALIVYGWLKSTTWAGMYWPVMVSWFLICSVSLHGMAAMLSRKEGAQGRPHYQN
jgi:predicted MFS family arabinose efflux permease